MLSAGHDMNEREELNGKNRGKFYQFSKEKNGIKKDISVTQSIIEASTGYEKYAWISKPNFKWRCFFGLKKLMLHLCYFTLEEMHDESDKVTQEICKSNG